MAAVTLREITADSVRAVCRLDVGPDQRCGDGAAALVIDDARTLPGVMRLRTSNVDKPGDASPLYLTTGFALTGEVGDGEIVLELPLRGA